jgi:redox-sensitive bicupin YhaK (pirin superfamily)
MTAGHGIVHSERSPEDLVRAHSRLNGIQLWVALPEEHEETTPSFVHHAASSLPEFAEGGVRLKLLLGSAFGRTSPVRVHSDMCYLDAHFSRGARLELPAGSRDYAFYVVSGSVRSGGQEVLPFAMGVGVSSGAVEIEALADSRVMIIGGTPLGKRHMYWNFVSSSKEALERAKADWARAPGATERFPLVPGDEVEFIPLPDEPGNPKGTPL